jgi:hypothetical protein
MAYVEGLRQDTDTDSQRQGTAWHGAHEACANALKDWLPADQETIRDVGVPAALAYLENRYRDIPAYKTAADWALERQILTVSIVGYYWYWQNDPIEFLASEVPFDLPVHEPRTGMPLPLADVKRVGKIDHVIKWQGSVGALERKSTSRSITPDSDYWDKGKKDTQVSMYALAMKDMAERAENHDPFGADCDRFGNTLYDVWHKPTIKPCMLTQAETKSFLASGEYYGRPFDVEAPTHTGHPDGDVTAVDVSGERCEIEWGKKGFAIKETIEMFGARLLADIYERPDHYFARREIARTDEELRAFRKELFAIYRSQRMMTEVGTWFSNEAQCKATFTCPFYAVCYGPGADSVCDGKTTPPGFKRIFVDLTINGQEVE